MGLEAQEVAVRLRLLHGTAFQAEADRAAESVERIGAAGKKVNAESTAAGGLTGFMSGASKSLDTMSGKLDSFAKKAHNIGRQTAILSLGAAGFIYESVKESAKTEAAFRQLETQAHASFKQRKELEASTPAFGKYGVGPIELAESLYGVQSVIGNVSEDIKAMQAASMGAAIGHDTLRHSSEALVAFWKDGHKGLKSYNEEMALLDETVGAGKMHLPELTQVASTGLFQTTGSYGINQRAVMGLLAGASQGLSEGGVLSFAQKLKTALTKAIDFKGQALAAAKQLGISKYELADDYRQGPKGLIDMLRKLQAGKGRLSPDVWQADVANMFGGSRSASTIFTALTALPAIEKITSRLEGVSGSTTLETHYGQMKGTSAQEFKVLKAEAQNLLKEAGEYFTPYVLKGAKDLVGLLHELIEGFKALPTPLKNVLGGTIAFAAILSPAAFLLGGVASGFKLMLGPFKGLVKLMQVGQWVSTASELGIISSTLPRLAFGFGVLGAAVGAFYLTLEKGKHPFNAWEEAYHQLFGGYTAKEKEEKRAKEHEQYKFLHSPKHLAELHRSYEILHRPHPWSRNTKDPQLKRELEALERGARAAGSFAEKAAQKIEFHFKLDMDGKQVALQIKKYEREHVNRR